MARAYICLARNDLDANLLQVMDLYPNSSLETVYQAYRGQTGYVTWTAQNSTVATHDAGAGLLHSTAEYYGLAAYLIDNVENNFGGGHLVLTAAFSNAIAAALLVRVAAGTTLGLTEINADIVSSTGAGASLTGGRSTGVVEEVLRIVAGEAYRLPAESILSGAAGDFAAVHRRKGKFLAATAVGTVTCATAIATDTFVLGGVTFTGRAGTENALTREFNITGTDATTAVSLATVINDPRNQALIGAANGAAHRTVTATASVSGSVITLLANQPGTFGNLTMSTNSALTIVLSGTTLDFTVGGYRGHRLIAETGELHLSKLSGNLSHLASATYTWLNPAFTYGATGTALTVSGGQILAAGAGRAVVVYDAAGNVI